LPTASVVRRKRRPPPWTSLRAPRTQKFRQPLVGYTAYVLSAQYFRSSGADAALSGYGAKIGGTWFSKSENSATEHRIVAVWAPLPFVIESAAKAVAESLPTATIKATSQGKLILKKLPIKNLKLF
jgi:hypothetical protein